MTLAGRLKEYALLVRLHRPIGILLLLWPTLWALWIAARGWPGARLFTVFALGTLLMRSAGCAINDFADRGFDGEVQRTADRPLAAQRIAPWEAVMVAAVLSLAAFVMVLIFLNDVVIWLSFVALFLAASYPFTKRFFAMPQAYLGIAFGFGIPMAFAAHDGSVPGIAWWLLVANIFWTIAYDTEYAMVDRDDDIRIGIRTTALLFGRFDVAAVMACYAAMLAVLAAVGSHLGCGVAFYAGLGAAAAIAVYHYMLVRARARADCFKAFLHNNWLGAAVFAGIAADFALR